MCSKASRRIHFITLLRRAGRCPDDLIQVYKSTIRSLLEYATELWHPGLTKTQSDQVEAIQERVLKIIHPESGYPKVLEETGLELLHERREARCRQFFTKISNESHKLNHLLPKVRDQTNKRFCKYEKPKVRTERLKKSPINYCLFNYQ